MATEMRPPTSFRADRRSKPADSDAVRRLTDTLEAPRDYTPLAPETLEVGTVYGPMTFVVSERSHASHRAFLSAAGLNAPSDPHLSPHELWPLARVLPAAGFGPLNEVISVRGSRELGSRTTAGQQLKATVAVERVILRGGLCFATLQSRTEDTVDPGLTFLVASDTIVLAHACDAAALLAAIAALANGRRLIVESPTAVIHEWTLAMRYPWPEAQWKNNIHTPTYAGALGYSRPLVEGPGVADAIFALHESTVGRPAVSIEWRYNRPLGVGLRVSLMKMRASSTLAEYAIFETPAGYPAEVELLMTAKVRWR